MATTAEQITRIRAVVGKIEGVEQATAALAQMAGGTDKVAEGFDRIDLAARRVSQNITRGDTGFDRLMRSYGDATSSAATRVERDFERISRAFTSGRFEPVGGADTAIKVLDSMVAKFAGVGPAVQEASARLKAALRDGAVGTVDAFNEIKTALASDQTLLTTRGSLAVNRAGAAPSVIDEATGTGGELRAQYERAQRESDLASVFGPTSDFERRQQAEEAKRNAEQRGSLTFNQSGSLASVIGQRTGVDTQLQAQYARPQREAELSSVFGAGSDFEQRQQADEQKQVIARQKSIEGFRDLEGSISPASRAAERFVAQWKTVNDALAAEPALAERAAAALAGIAEEQFTGGGRNKSPQRAQTVAQAAQAALGTEGGEEQVRAAALNAAKGVQELETSHKGGALAARLYAIQLVQTASSIQAGMPVWTTLVQQGHQVVDIFLATGGKLSDIGGIARGFAGALFSVPGAIVAVGGAFAALAVAGEVAQRGMERIQNSLIGVRDNYKALATEVRQAGRELSASTSLSRDQGTALVNAIYQQPNFQGSADPTQRRTQAVGIGKEFDAVNDVLGRAPGDLKALGDAFERPAELIDELARRRLPGFNTELQNQARLWEAAGNRAQATDAILQRLHDTESKRESTLTPLEQAERHLDEAMQKLTGSGEGLFTLIGTRLVNAIAFAVDKLAIFVGWMDRIGKWTGSEQAANVRNNIISPFGQLSPEQTVNQTRTAVAQAQAQPGNTGPGHLVTQDFGGIKYTVAEPFAPLVQGFLGDLKSAGYEIKSVGGYNDRNIAGTNTRSFHASGAAFDINPTENPVNGGTNMPSNIQDIAKRWGLGWGGAWTGPKTDPMHFSFASEEGGAFTVPRGQVFSGVGGTGVAQAGSDPEQAARNRQTLQYRRQETQAQLGQATELRDRLGDTGGQGYDQAAQRVRDLSAELYRLKSAEQEVIDTERRRLEGLQVMNPAQRTLTTSMNDFDENMRKATGTTGDANQRLEYRNLLLQAGAQPVQQANYDAGIQVQSGERLARTYEQSAAALSRQQAEERAREVVRNSTLQGTTAEGAAVAGLTNRYLQLDEQRRRGELGTTQRQGRQQLDQIGAEQRVIQLDPYTRLREQARSQEVNRLREQGYTDQQIGSDPDIQRRIGQSQDIAIAERNKAVGEQLRVNRENQESLDRMSGSYLKSAQSVQELQSREEAIRVVREAAIHGTEAQRAAVEALTKSNQDLAHSHAADQVNTAARTARIGAETTNYEASIVGVPVKQQSQLLAERQARVQANAAGLGPNDEATQNLVQYAKEQAAANDNLNLMKQSWSEVEQTGSRALDTLQQGLEKAFHTGKIKDFATSALQMLQDIGMEGLKLSLMNPLKNWLFGSNSPTIGSVGQAAGGAGGAIGGLTKWLFGSSDKGGGGSSGLTGSGVSGVGSGVGNAVSSPGALSRFWNWITGGSSDSGSSSPFNAAGGNFDLGGGFGSGSVASGASAFDAPGFGSFHGGGTVGAGIRGGLPASVWDGASRFHTGTDLSDDPNAATGADEYGTLGWFGSNQQNVGGVSTQDDVSSENQDRGPGNALMTAATSFVTAFASKAIGGALSGAFGSAVGGAAGGAAGGAFSGAGVEAGSSNFSANIGSGSSGTVFDGETGITWARASDVMPNLGSNFAVADASTGQTWAPATANLNAPNFKIYDNETGTVWAARRHRGGMADSTGVVPMPSPVFDGADRFHTGWAGASARRSPAAQLHLAHDEVPAILQKGEVVLTQAQQHRVGRRRIAAVLHQGGYAATGTHGPEFPDSVWHGASRFHEGGSLADSISLPNTLAAPTPTMPATARMGGGRGGDRVVVHAPINVNGVKNVQEFANSQQQIRAMAARAISRATRSL